MEKRSSIFHVGIHSYESREQRVPHPDHFINNGDSLECPIEGRELFDSN